MHAAPFEYKAEVLAEDGTTEMVTLTLKPFDRLPIGVMRRNRHDAEAQMWATFEWGLTEDQLPVFDRLPAMEVEKILEAWQESSEDIKARIEQAQEKAVEKGKAAPKDVPAVDDEPE